VKRRYFVDEESNPPLGASGWWGVYDSQDGVGGESSTYCSPSKEAAEREAEKLNAQEEKHGS
jgi:hypothetical protein